MQWQLGGNRSAKEWWAFPLSQPLRRGNAVQALPEPQSIVRFKSRKDALMHTEQTVFPICLHKASKHRLLRKGPCVTHCCCSFSMDGMSPSAQVLKSRGLLIMSSSPALMERLASTPLPLPASKCAKESSCGLWVRACRCLQWLAGACGRHSPAIAWMHVHKGGQVRCDGEKAYLLMHVDSTPLPLPVGTLMKESRCSTWLREPACNCTLLTRPCACV